MVVEKSKLSSLIPLDTGLALATQFLTLFGKQVIYVCVDSTWKTNLQGLELFVMMGVFEGEGYPLSYLFLERGQERKNVLVKW